jgi:tetratricopeptide (TPR) repeat protein
VSLFYAPFLWAQDPLASSSSISLYELSYRPPKQALKLFDKGSSELKLRHYQVALKLLKKALAIDPLYFAAENNLGYTYLQLDQQSAAEQAFKRALEIDPGNAVGHLNLCIAAMNRGNFRLAEKAARLALQLNPQMVEAKAMLGYAEVGQGRWTTEARKLLEESRDVVPGSGVLLSNWPEPNTRGPSVNVVTVRLR